MEEKLFQTIVHQFKTDIKRVLKSQDSKEIYTELSRMFSYLLGVETALKVTQQEVPLELTHLIVTIEMLEELYRA